MSYTYSEPEDSYEAPEILPEGAYDFVVSGIQSEFSGDKDKFGGTVKLALGADKVWMFASLYAGRQKKDPSKRYDMIAPFLKAIGKAPAAGQEPDFSKRALMGSKGKVMIRHGEWNGKTKMEVDHFIYDKSPTTVGSDNDGYDKDEIPGVSPLPGSPFAPGNTPPKKNALNEAF